MNETTPGQDALVERLERAGRAEAETSGLTPDQLEGLWAGVRAETCAAPSTWRERLRELPTGVRIALALGVASVIAAMMVLITGARGGEIGTPLTSVLLALCALVLLAVASFAVSLRGVHQPPLRRWTWVVIAVALVLPFALALIPPASLGVTVSSLACLSIGLATGTLVSVPVFLMQRASVPVLARASAALAGGGAIAYAVLELHCPSRDMTHLLVSHALVGTLLVAVSAVVVWARQRH